MRELSLFTGIGGGLLASKLLGWKTVCCVEVDNDCVKVLQQRQQEELLDQCSIYRDIKEFSGLGFCGKIDVVTGGFPCQAFSSAARGRNNAEDLWPEMYRVITEVRPTYVFAENVKEFPILRASEQLAGLGYYARYMRLSAADLGAPHQRDRYWLAAYANPNGELRCPEYVETPGPSALPLVEWWQDDSRRLGVSNGVSDRLVRLKGLGNAQVPIVAAMAWKLLSSAFGAK